MSERGKKAYRGLLYMKNRLYNYGGTAVDDDNNNNNNNLAFLFTEKGYSDVMHYLSQRSSSSIKRYCLLILWILKERDVSRIPPELIDDHDERNKWYSLYLRIMRMASQHIRQKQRVRVQANKNNDGPVNAALRGEVSNVRNVYVHLPAELWRQIEEQLTDAEELVNRKCNSHKDSVLENELNEIIQRARDKSKGELDHRRVNNTKSQIRRMFKRLQDRGMEGLNSFACVIKANDIIKNIIEMFEQDRTISWHTCRSFYVELIFCLEHTPEHIISDRIKPFIHKTYLDKFLRTIKRSALTIRRNMRTKDWEGYYGLDWIGTKTAVRNVIDGKRGTVTDMEKLVLLLYFELPVRRTKDYTSMVVVDERASSSARLQPHENVFYIKKKKDKIVEGKFVFRNWKNCYKTGVQHQLIKPGEQYQQRLIDVINQKMRDFPSDKYLLMKFDRTKQGRVAMNYEDVMSTLLSLDKKFGIPVGINKLRHLYATYIHNIPENVLGMSRPVWEEKIATLMGTSRNMLMQYYIDEFETNPGDEPYMAVEHITRTRPKTKTKNITRTEAKEKKTKAEKKATKTKNKATTAAEKDLVGLLKNANVKAVKVSKKGGEDELKFEETFK